jgi:hypothetical protein
MTIVSTQTNSASRQRIWEEKNELTILDVPGTLESGLDVILLCTCGDADFHDPVSPAMVRLAIAGDVDRLAGVAISGTIDEQVTRSRSLAVARSAPESRAARKVVSPARPSASWREWSHQPRQPRVHPPRPPAQQRNARLRHRLTAGVEHTPPHLNRAEIRQRRGNSVLRGGWSFRRGRCRGSTQRDSAAHADDH